MPGDTDVGSFAVDLGEWFEAHAIEVKANLELYFLGVGGDPFNGRHFERFSAMSDPDRFAATDVLAVEALSVRVPPNSAAKLLDTEAEDFNSLLRQIPVDRDIWEVPVSDLGAGSPALTLYRRLKALDGVGSVTATKLMASKRPRLMPVIDSVVTAVLQPPGGKFWLPMRNQLADADRRQKIAKVVSCAPDNVTLLRRIDVAVWMYGRATT